MRLHTLKPGSRRPRKRRGRGHSAGQGKTCGRGQKGQHARSGGYHKTGFEGGQMPLQRRLPKVGFASRTAAGKAELTLHELGRADDDVIDLDSLKRAGVIGERVRQAKVILSGRIDKPIKARGISFTRGARAAVEAAGGSIED